MKFASCTSKLYNHILIAGLILVLFMCSTKGDQKVTINEFNNKIFWEKDMQGMVELDLFFSNVTDSMMIVAVADMNGDKFTDIITVNQERSAFRVFLYNNHLKEFVFGEREFPVNCIIANIQTIKTSNKNAGLLVTCSKPESIIKTFKYDDYIHDFTELIDKRIRIQRGNQPFIADFDGDFFPDLLYMDDEGIKISSQATTVKSFEKNPNDQY